MKCSWCGRDDPFPCANSRDMTERAIEGDDACYAKLNALGGGEKGMRYVDTNRVLRNNSGGDGGDPAANPRGA